MENKVGTLTYSVKDPGLHNSRCCKDKYAGLLDSSLVQHGMMITLANVYQSVSGVPLVLCSVAI